MKCHAFAAAVAMVLSAGAEAAPVELFFKAKIAEKYNSATHVSQTDLPGAVTGSILLAESGAPNGWSGFGNWEQKYWNFESGCGNFYNGACFFRHDQGTVQSVLGYSLTTPFGTFLPGPLQNPQWDTRTSVMKEQILGQSQRMGMSYIEEVYVSDSRKSSNYSESSGFDIEIYQRTDGLFKGLLDAREFNVDKFISATAHYYYSRNECISGRCTVGAADSYMFRITDLSLKPFAAAVPEPVSGALFGVGMAGLVFARRRKKDK